MKVEDVMTRNVKSCRPETNLSQVAAQMWDYDFVAMPVVDDENRVMGMITDRDIAIAAATKGRLATEINVGEVISGNVYACALDEEIGSALKTMRRERVSWRASSRSMTSCFAPERPRENRLPKSLMRTS